MKILHQDEYDNAETKHFADELYFQLIHNLKGLAEPVLPQGYSLCTATLFEYAEHISSCYEEIGITEEELRSYTVRAVYDAALWLAVKETHTGTIVATGIAELDREIGEGVLEWIQVSKDHRGKGLVPVFPLEWHDPKSGDVSSGYRESGYLPEAVINFLALLGWNPGNDQEIMSMDELIALFKLERCSKAGAKFDFEKGRWFNHQYLQMTDNRTLAELFMKDIEAAGVETTIEKAEQVVGYMKSRVNFVKELWPLCSFFWIAPTSYDEKAVAKRWKAETPAMMAELRELLAAWDNYDNAEATEEYVKGWCEAKGYGLGNVMNPFRLMLVGELKGPHMFEVTAVLGKEETLRRMDVALNSIKTYSNKDRKT